MRIVLSVALVPFIATGALAAGYGRIDSPRDTDPLTLAGRFCDARIHGDMSPLERHFAPKLARLLDEAVAHASAIPWQARPYRPTACTLEILNGQDDTIGVLVRITYTSPQGSWSDIINMERTPDSWLINNVFYEGGGNLRFRLFETPGA